ncbi:DUF4291 family protein [Chitinophagaceae bacterium MMS25-I14]
MERKIYADFDDGGVYVYQAFKPEIVQVAVENGKFGKGFGLDRLSWIKPSYGWVLRRSEYATKYRMEGIARIKIAHHHWLEILEQSVETQWNPDTYNSEDEWQRLLNRTDVIHQWDPERDLQGRRLDRQAIQIGLRGEALKKYVTDYVMGVEDVSALSKEIGLLAKARKPIDVQVPEEREYPLSEVLFHKLGCM